MYTNIYIYIFIYLYSYVSTFIYLFTYIFIKLIKFFNFHFEDALSFDTHKKKNNLPPWNKKQIIYFIYKDF